MKYVLGLFVILSSSLGNACYVEPTKAQSKKILSFATDYFIDSIVGQNNALVSTLALDVNDCHDYDGEFSSFTIELKWRQKLQNKYQTCTQELGINDAEIEYKDSINCVSE